MLTIQNAEVLLDAEHPDRTYALIALKSIVTQHYAYPRLSVNTHAVQRMLNAAKTGKVRFPHIIIEAETWRLVDGAHRIRCFSTLLPEGEDALVTVEVRRYQDDREFFLDCVRANATHGTPLSTGDHARCLTIAEESGVSYDELASALNVLTERLQALRISKVAYTPSMKPLALKTTCKHLAGKTMTETQIEGNRKAQGSHQGFLLQQIINLFEHDLLDLENTDIRNRVVTLRDIINSRAL